MLRRRPDVRSALQRMEAADRREAQALAARFPSFRLGGALSSSERTARAAANATNLVWDAALSVAHPLLRAEDAASAVDKGVVNVPHDVLDEAVRGERSFA